MIDENALLDKFIHFKEQQTIEHKEKLSFADQKNRHDLVEDILAMANAHTPGPSYLFIGIKNNGEIVGAEDPGDRKMIDDLLKEYVTGQIHWDLKHYEAESGKVLWVIRVEQSSVRPLRFTKSKKKLGEEGNWWNANQSPIREATSNRDWNIGDDQQLWTSRQSQPKIEVHWRHGNAIGSRIETIDAVAFCVNAKDRINNHNSRLPLMATFPRPTYHDSILAVYEQTMRGGIWIMDPGSPRISKDHLKAIKADHRVCANVSNTGSFEATNVEIELIPSEGLVFRQCPSGTLRNRRLYFSLNRILPLRDIGEMHIEFEEIPIGISKVEALIRASEVIGVQSSTLEIYNVADADLQL